MLQPNVARLDVAVDQIPRVGGGQCLADLNTQTKRLNHGERSLSFQTIVQRLAFQILHRQKRHAAMLSDSGDDMIGEPPNDVVQSGNSGQTSFKRSLMKRILRLIVAVLHFKATAISSIS